MHWKKILLVGGILMVALVAGLCVQKPEGIEPTPLQPAEELKLSDFPEAFKDGTLIIVGDNASDIEMQAVNEIADYLENKTGNKPLIKKYSEISEEDKRNYNLIVVGTPKTNPFLEEVYALTNATRVTEEFPGEGMLLQILENPWCNRNILLMITGNTFEWIKEGEKELLKASSVEGDTVIIGKIKTPLASRAPTLEKCIGPAPIITVNNKTFYLKNICSYLKPKEEGLGLFGKIARIEGWFKKNGYEIIIVSNLEVIRRGQE